MSVHIPLLHGISVAQTDHIDSYVSQAPVGNGSDVTISHV